MNIQKLVKPDFIVLNDEAPLSELIGKLRQYEKKTCLIYQGKKYIGLIEKKQLLRSRLDVAEAKVKHFVQMTPVLSETTDLLEAARLLSEEDLNFLPVEQGKEIKWVIDGLSIAQSALLLSTVKQLKVNDLKILKNVSIQKDDPLAKAIEVMYESHLDHLPVFEGKVLYGVLSYKDILRKYLNWSPKRDVSTKFNKMAESRGSTPNMPNLASLPVSDFSTNDLLISVTGDDPLKNAIKLMADNKISAVLLMEGEDYLGLVTLRNILGKIGELQESENYTLQYVGLKDLSLTDHQKQVLEKTCVLEAEKIGYSLDNFKMVLHFKEYIKEGKKPKYSVHLKVEAPGKMISVSEDDWNFDDALHSTFVKAKTILEHQQKTKKKVSSRME